ncbi:polymorphic toxin-type HINT domain-containing protein [Halioxenophilus sp. WMMB6]|uniref:polymorphic toxin-type HINT domain-containing protein n=1 Tax=Halioxenophilus sp. WMMB6 TaxID=3073815 RepID=UPI00295E6C7A|nr:polymorphic toxin-type HINT domain-containing protein [Halioxenophilus sp. WMMB6]
MVLGEKLWAKNVETGEQDWKPVTKIFIEPGRGIYEINLLGGDGFEQKIEATDDHPFYVVGQGWKATIELEVGDRIETDGDGPMVVVSVVDEERQDLTYNFTVADFHTYYVTERNVLVHNCSIGGGDVAKSATKNRVKLRKSTREQIDANQPKNANGEMVDPHSGDPLKPGEIDVGHKPGQEWRKRAVMHEERGSTRREVIEAENNPDLYHLEDRSSNRSHRYEE